MAIKEETFLVTYEKGNYKSGLALEEYNGAFSIVSCEDGKDGKLWPRWCFPQDKDKKPREKALPMKINLGDDKPAAIALLRLMADILDGSIGDNEPCF